MFGARVVRQSNRAEDDTAPGAPRRTAARANRSRTSSRLHSRASHVLARGRPDWPHFGPLSGISLVFAAPPPASREAAVSADADAEVKRTEQVEVRDADGVQWFEFRYDKTYRTQQAELEVQARLPSRVQVTLN